MSVDWCWLRQFFFTLKQNFFDLITKILALKNRFFWSNPKNIDKYWPNFLLILTENQNFNQKYQNLKKKNLKKLLFDFFHKL